MSDHAPNDLINSTSPYLKQHAYNPVQWVPWSQDVFIRAAREDKLVIISIGYSACHWCHVMEKQCFEDYEVAEIMNRHFISVKVDREERPDVDQVYMAAVQLMTGNGGWPLNCFTLPDGRPVYGGTYFPKHQWIHVLLTLSENYSKSRDQFEDYAQRLTEGMNQLERVQASGNSPLMDRAGMLSLIGTWKKDFDPEHGGPGRAPKFPMPVNLRFLLHSGIRFNDPQLTDHVALTLRKMACGGIYDQLGGGFARYSVDTQWKVPHFEKMLYDNAQLVSLYSEFYKWKPDPLFETVIRETIGFIDREFAAPDGGYYCALDADSEGVEGKFYTWTKQELKDALGAGFALFADFYQVDDRGLWEDERYILLREADIGRVATAHGLTESRLLETIQTMKETLMRLRALRVRPGLDNKRLTSWNGLVAVAFLDAYESLGDEKFLDHARAVCSCILDRAGDGSGGLLHLAGPGPRVDGFLEDYAFMIAALIRLYPCTGERSFLDQAVALTTAVFERFENDNGSMFYFSPAAGDKLISRRTEIQDNVIPASNSQMAINLFLLGHYIGNEIWVERSKIMLQDMKSNLISYPQGYANWLLLWMMHAHPLLEIAVCGKNALIKMREISHALLPPGTLASAAVSRTDLPLVRDRFVDDRTLIYVCSGKACHLPLEHPEDALKLLMAG